MLCNTCGLCQCIWKTICFVQPPQSRHPFLVLLVLQAIFRPVCFSWSSSAQYWAHKIKSADKLAWSGCSERSTTEWFSTGSDAKMVVHDFVWAKAKCVLIASWPSILPNKVFMTANKIETDSGTKRREEKKSNEKKVYINIYKHVYICICFTFNF